MKIYIYHILILFKNLKSITKVDFVCNSLIMSALVVMLLLSTSSGCKKWVQVESPKTSVNSLNVYENDATAISVLTSIYTSLSISSLQSADGLSSISYFTGLSSDELTLTPSGLNDQILSAYYTNKLNSQLTGYEFWNNIYTKIYITNAALEGISSSTTLTAAVKQQLIGEAKFIRALYFFYLVNLYGDVPLVLSTDYKVNALMPRTPQDQVWKQIILDLEDAEISLSQQYLDGSLLKSTLERVRPTKSAATALLARAYLYTKKWGKAEEKASNVIQNPLYRLVSLDEVFKKNNDEAIWQLQPVLNYINTAEAIAFIILPDADLASTPVALSQTLLNSFDSGDLRKSDWVKNINIDGIDLSFAYKYKVPRSIDVNVTISEYSTVLRLAEQYLIRAEAKIQQGKISEGISDLNILRERATDKSPQAIQLKQLPASMLEGDALKAVEHERQLELFTEWGHRWLDLKRTSRIDGVMSSEVPRKKVGWVWNSYKQWYPISLYELQHNPRMAQNSGY